MRIVESLYDLTRDSSLSYLRISIRTHASYINIETVEPTITVIGKITQFVGRSTVFNVNLTEL